MTFKEFQKWCNKRACDGCWGYLNALICIDKLKEIKSLPFWKRERAWKRIEGQMLREIIEPTNKKIHELRRSE